MTASDTTLLAAFVNSGEEARVSLDDLVAALKHFLERFGERSLVGEEFKGIIQDGPGRERLARLLSACGRQDDPRGFFQELLASLGKADGRGGIAVNGVAMPHLLLMEIMELVLPGNRFISVKSVDKLEKLANLKVPPEQRAAMQEVIDTYPVRLSMHTIRQMRVSRGVAYQYLPFVEELDSVGHTNTWIGQFHQGLLEQMYQNRVIFLLNMSCPVYCRFCFRKHKESRNETNPTVADVQKAIEHVANSPEVKEIVMTGGDAFMNRRNMAAAIDGLMEVDHVQTLRLATRSIAYYPHMFLGEDGEMLRFLKRKSLELQDRGKRMEVATHFIHPDEISPQSLQIINDLVNNGIPVYVQTPFLNDCNDQGPELVKLFSLLRGAGAELHYIYIPCSPIHGNSIYWSPLSRGLDAGNYLRAHLSDRVIPRICTATPIGKLDWHSSGWAAEPVEGNDDFMWLRTPYTPEYFKNFAPLANELDNIRVNGEGTIEVRYMARIGDESLFLGQRPPRPAKGGRPEPSQDPARFLAQAPARQGLSPSLVRTGLTDLSRVHQTRVEVLADCGREALEYIGRDSRVTDVVVVPEDDVTESLYHVSRLVAALGDAPHVNAVRLKSPGFNHRPECFTPAVIDKLASLNRLSMVNPLRLEIECQFITAGELKPAHAKLARQLNNRGITVYNNTPLLGGINDSDQAIHDLAYACRAAGIEFHHLYVAGLPLQKEWNQANPVSLYDVVDIATKVRREGSGREVPRYVIATVLGEVDFGLGTRFHTENGQLHATLLPYDLAHFQGLDPDFTWPEGVATDERGRPVLKLAGLVKETDFALS